MFATLAPAIEGAYSIRLLISLMVYSAKASCGILSDGASSSSASRQACHFEPRWTIWAKQAVLLKSVNKNLLPGDLVLITRSGTGNGDKSSVLQSLLGYQSLSRACLVDDNIEVLGELSLFSGLPLHVKTQRKETWNGRSEWNIDQSALTHHTFLSVQSLRVPVGCIECFWPAFAYHFSFKCCLW